MNKTATYTPQNTVNCFKIEKCFDWQVKVIPIVLIVPLQQRKGQCSGKKWVKSPISSHTSFVFHIWSIPWGGGNHPTGPGCRHQQSEPEPVIPPYLFELVTLTVKVFPVLSINWSFLGGLGLSLRVNYRISTDDVRCNLACSQVNQKSFQSQDGHSTTRPLK